MKSKERIMMLLSGVLSKLDSINKSLAIGAVSAAEVQSEIINIRNTLTIIEDSLKLEESY
jgi:hypothetical protein